MKTYTQALAKLAVLIEQEKTVTTKLRGIAQEQQAAQSHLKEAIEQAAAARGKVMRGSALDEELAEADTQSEALLAQVQLDVLQSDEQVCRKELVKLQSELAAARSAVSAALQNFCHGIAEQLGESLKSSPKLRTQLVAIFVAYAASTGRSLGSALGGTVDWSGVLEGLFPMPTDAEYEAAYGRFASQVRGEK